MITTTYTTADGGPGRNRPPSSPALSARAPAERPAAAMTVLDHPIAQHALTALRRRQTGAPDFQTHCRQLLLLLTLEATRTMPTAPRTVTAQGGDHEGRGLARPVVFITVTRHGLGLAANVADLVPGVTVGSVSVDSQRDGQPEARLHMFHAPALGQVSVLLFAPVIASGLSATVALNLLRRSGANDVALLSFVISNQALGNIRRAFPETPIWTAAVDQEWDAKLGPLPGIWDFPGRICG